MGNAHIHDEDLKKAFEIAEKLEIKDYQTVSIILDGKNRVTPWMVSELDDDQIFVFGSNNKGAHLWRSSNFARENFGAKCSFLI